MTECRPPNHSRLDPKRLEALKRLDKATLIEIIAQMVTRLLTGSDVLDDAILRAKQNQLHARWLAEEDLGTEAMKRHDWRVAKRHHEKSTRLHAEIMATFKEKP